MTLVYIACDAAAIGTGSVVLFGLLKGSLREKFAALFLRFALITSVLGLLFPLPHILLTQKQEISMLTVYLSGLAIIAWHKLDMAGVWRSTFVLSATLVLYLSVLAAIAQVFRRMPLFGALSLSQFKLSIYILHAVILLIFAALGAAAARRFRRNKQWIRDDITVGIRRS